MLQLCHFDLSTMEPPQQPSHRAIVIVTIPVVVNEDDDIQAEMLADMDYMNRSNSLTFGDINCVVPMLLAMDHNIMQAADH